MMDFIEIHDENSGSFDQTKPAAGILTGLWRKPDTLSHTHTDRYSTLDIRSPGRNTRPSINEHAGFVKGSVNRRYSEGLKTL